MPVSEKGNRDEQSEEEVAKFQSPLAPALFLPFLQFHSFFLAPHSATEIPTPIVFSRVSEFTTGDGENFRSRHRFGCTRT